MSWRMFLGVVLCCCLAVGFGLVACGDDDNGDDGGGGGCDNTGILNRSDCELGCEELVACGEHQSVSQCVEECVGWSNTVKACMCGCDIDAGCVVFPACVESCLASSVAIVGTWAGTAFIENTSSTINVDITFHANGTVTGTDLASGTYTVVGDTVTINVTDDGQGNTATMTGTISGNTITGTFQFNNVHNDHGTFSLQKQ